jgi:hypothetical protein
MGALPADWSPVPAAAALLFASLVGSTSATAQTGPPISLARPPPVSSATSACSFRHAICVHARAVTPPSLLLASLASADHAWDVLTGALALPPPNTDLDGAWNVYLVDDFTSWAPASSPRSVAQASDDTPGYASSLLLERDPRTGFDSGISFALVDRATPPGCLLDLALARAFSRASLWRSAPATDEGSARAQTEMLARLAVPCAAPQDDAQDFQSHPERTIVDPSSSAFDRGASLFFGWLDAKFAREPGALLRGLWALAPARTAPGAWRWSATPTGFDVLRVSLKGALGPDSTLDDVFVRFALQRARATPAVRLAWRIPWPAQARRLASPEPVSPTGASYVLVDHAGAPAGAKLRLEAQWEDYARMRWVVVKLDAAGKTMAELPVTSLDRATRASMTVESLEGVDRVLIVGINVGSTEHPFDPDQGEWEPHGWLLTMGAE